MGSPDSQMVTWEERIPDEFLPQLIDAYKEAFCPPPRHESWTDAEASAFMLSHLEKGGHCIASLQDGRLSGAEFSMPLAQWHDRELFSGCADPSQSTYLSVIFVRPAWRDHGLGLKLIEAELDYSRQRAQRQVCARTRQDTPEIIALFQKCQFVKIGCAYREMGGVGADHLLFCRTL